MDRKNKRAFAVVATVENGQVLKFKDYKEKHI